MPSVSRLYHRAVQLLSQSGFGHLARCLRPGEPCILTFHGLRADDDPGLIDTDLHTPVSIFREICGHLARSYRVMPLSGIIRRLERRLPLPDGTVAITFDDGYASNHDLAFPVLREFDLPATIFVTSGFVDRTENLWFHRLEYAFAKTGQGGDAFGKAAREIKSLPQEQIGAALDRIESELGTDYAAEANKPAIFQPLTWAQIREMHDSGVIEFGGHTHRHLIVGRCTTETAREEIQLSHRRLADELGTVPTLFAYPNGQPGDYTAESAALLREAGYTSAVTMSPGFVSAACDRFAIPRYGAPTTLAETEGTVSGTFETLKELRLATREALAA